MNDSILDNEYTREEVSLENARFAGFWVRLGASLIDSLILLPFILLNFYNSLNIKSLPLMLVLTSVFSIYKPYLEWKKSATFGKMAMGIKVVDESLNNISGEQAIKRYFPWIISFIFSIIVSIQMFTSPEFQEVNKFLELGTITSGSPMNSISTFYNIIFIILVGSLIFNAKKQGFHDKFAGTYCIKIN